MMWSAVRVGLLVLATVLLAQQIRADGTDAVYTSTLFTSAGFAPFSGQIIPLDADKAVTFVIIPSTGELVTFNLTGTLHENDVNVFDRGTPPGYDPAASTSHLSVAVLADGFLYAAADTQVYKFDPNDLNATAAQVNFVADVDITFSTVNTAFRLSNDSTNLVGFPDSSSARFSFFKVTDFTEAGRTVVVSTNSFESDTNPSPVGYTLSTSIADDYVLVARDYAPTGTLISRISLAHGLNPTPAILIAGLSIAQGDMYYDATNEALYLAGQNSANRAVLVQVNYTNVDDGLTLTNLTIEAPATRDAFDSQDGEIRSKVLSSDDEADYQPVAITVDPIGGQVFVTYTDQAAHDGAWRLSQATLELANPPLIFFQPAGKGLYFKGDATSSANNRWLVANQRGNVVSYNVPSACPADCGESLASPTGQCVGGVCQCVAGRHGVDCAGIACQTNCSEAEGHGTCGVNGVCVCNSTWTGDNCQDSRCPNDCSNNGQCSGAPDFVCTCSELWASADCSLPAYLACESFTTEQACVRKAGACGWCADTKKCVTGNYDGPFEGSCRAWYVGGKFQVGLLIVAIIFIVVWLFMLLVDLFSAMPMDYVTAGVLVDSSLLTTDLLKEAYWRDERSAKTWKMFDLFQFISYYAFINVSFPTQLIQFTRYFNFAMLSLPLPYGAEDNTTLHLNRRPGNKRDLLNVDQFANSLKIDTETVYYGVMFWFVILTAGAMLIYGIYALFMWLFLRKKEPNIKTVLLQKAFYVLTRIALFAYFPIVLTSAWHIRAGHDNHPGSIAAAVITLIVFGILPIAFNAVIVWNKGKELLFLYLKLRFGALYSVYHYEKARFNLLVLSRKFIVACLIGFLAAPATTPSDKLKTYLYAQVGTVIAVLVLYIVAALVIRPYLDQVHLVLDIVMMVLFAIAFGVAILHKDSPNLAGQIVAGVCIILIFLACLLAFIHSWWNISGRATYPWIMCGEKYNGIEEDEAAAAEMDPAAARSERRKKEAALQGVLPGAKKPEAAPEAEEESSADSSLQSSSDSDPEEESSSEK